jgi:hypothetical protein
MARKAVSISARVDRKFVLGPKHARRSAKTASLREVGHAARSRNRGLTAPVGFKLSKILQVTDDFPVLIPVVDRELDIIETYLGACLEQLLEPLA